MGTLRKRMTRSNSIAGRGVAAFLFLAAAFPSVYAQTKPKIARDWAKYPAIVQIDTTAGIFALGDIHGDCDRLIKLLTGAKLVESVPPSPTAASSTNLRWIAGKSVLVVTGDMIDKGPKAPAVLLLMRSLSEEAARAGGQVVVTMGNHEVDFLRNPDKANEFSAQLKASGLDPKAIAACTGDLGVYLCGLPFAARVNDWFFSHAGSTGGRTMNQLISDLQNGVDKDGFATTQLIGENSLIAARLGEQGPGGKSWFESGGTQQSADQLLAANAAALHVAHIVQGHQHAPMRFPDGQQRKLGELYQWHGRLFILDTGMSQDINESVGAMLHIQRGSATVVCPGGRVARLWVNTQKPDSAKGVRCGQ